MKKIYFSQYFPYSIAFTTHKQDILCEHEKIIIFDFRFLQEYFFKKYSCKKNILYLFICVLYTFLRLLDFVKKYLC